MTTQSHNGSGVKYINTEPLSGMSMSEITKHTMPSEQTVTKLLIISDNPSACNRLISSLRDAGLGMMSVVASNVSTLAEHLNSEQWDVLVYQEQSEVSIKETLGELRKHQQDTPLILNTNSEYSEAELPSLYQQGITDIVPAEQVERLQVSILREASRYALLKQLRALDITHQELQDRHHVLLENSPVAISYIRDGIHLYCNASYAKIFGYPDIDTIRTTPLLNLIDESHRAAIKNLLTSASTSPQQTTLPALLHHGGSDDLQLNFIPVEFAGKPCLQLTAVHPKGNEAFSSELETLTGQDLLTSLENENAFTRHIEQAIRLAIKEQQFSSLLLIEVNNFTELSHSIGKTETNKLLNELCSLLKNHSGSALSIGRLEEQMFGMLLPLGDPDELLTLASSIEEELNNRLSDNTPTSVNATCSAGMTLINGHALNAQDVINRAHLSLEQDLTSTSKSLFRIGESLQYDAGEMLDYLEQALQEKRFKMVYQPIVGISGNNQQYYEVLIRMLDKDGNEILPGAFLPLATMNGLGENLDRMVVTMALDALQRSPEVQRLTVNITNNTLISATFLPWLSEQIRDMRIDASRLGIDISEISLHSFIEDATEFCQGLEVLGVTLTLSHFGGAVDPFALLDQLNPDLVTLEETIVRDLIYSPQQKTSVQSIVKSLHNRKLLVVTPRVEDMAVLPILWELGVDFVQGYCLQAPSNEMNYEFVQDEEITLTAPSQ